MKKMRLLVPVSLIALTLLLVFTPVRQARSQASEKTDLEKLIERVHAQGAFLSGVVEFPPPSGGRPPSGGANSLTANLNPGSDVRVTTDPAAQNETSISHDPNALDVLVGGGNDYRNGDVQCGYYLSTDTGGSWSTQGTLLPRPQNLNAAGDPSVDFDNNHMAYYGCLGFHRQRGSSGVYVYAGNVSDSSLDWREPTEVAFSRNTKNFHDKPYIVADKLSGKVCISWTWILQGEEMRIAVACSEDGGVSFDSPSATIINDSHDNEGQGSVPAIAGDGSVYVVWWGFRRGGMLIDRSLDGGKTWGADAFVSSVNTIDSPLSGTDFRTNSFPTLGVDPVNSNVVYLAWADDRTGDADILFVRCEFSADGMICTDPPLQVNGEPTGSATDQFFPWMSVATDGTISVVYYSRRNDTDATMDVYLTWSEDGGSNFNNVEVTDAPTDQNDGWGDFIGDYNGITAHNTRAHPLWTAGFKDPDGSNNQDLYTDAVEWTGKDIHDVAVTRTEAEPSTVTQGDRVTITVDLANQGTYTETFSVEVTSDNATPNDTTDDITITSDSIELIAGAILRKTYTWTTSSSTSTGDHTITATAGSVSDETDTADNSKSTTVTVEAPSTADSTMHVGDLDGQSVKLQKGNWEAVVTVTVHDSNDDPVADATVSGAWSVSGGDATSSCTTGSNGTCQVGTGRLDRTVKETTFTVEDVTHDTLTYESSDNNDPDGDSDGTSITVSK